MNAVINLLVFGNILIALAAGFLTGTFSRFIGVENEFWYGAMLFFGTLFIYNFQRFLRFKEISNSKSSRHQWIINNKKKLYFLIISSGLGATITFYFLVSNTIALLVLLIVCLVSLLYAYRFNSKTATVRELPYLKIHIIALSWTLLSFVWPVINSDLPFTFNIFWTCVAVYLYFIGITIPFDIRDLPYDLKRQKTLPQLLGVNRSKILAIVLLFISALILIITHPVSVFNPFLYITYIVQLLLLVKADTSSKELLFSGGIDGSILFFGLFWLFQ